MAGNRTLHDAALDLVRILKPLADVERARRVDMALTNDGRVVRDRVIGLITMIENRDQELADSISGELEDILGALNDPATGTFLYDAFTDADGTLLTAHTGTIGATWTADSAGDGAFTIQDGKVYGTDTGFVYASGESPIPDYKVEADFQYLNDTGENAIALRIQPGQDTGYYLYYNSGAFRLVRRVSGTDTSLGSYAYSSSLLPVTAGLAVSGDRLDIFVAGEGRVSIIDANPITAKGRAGLRSRPVTSTTGQHLDNVRGSAYVIQMTDLQDLIGALEKVTSDEDAPDDVSQALKDLNTSLRGVLGDKRDKSVKVPQSDVESSQSNQDLAEDIGDLLGGLAAKRDKNVDIPQTDVSSSLGNSSLTQDLAALLADLATKVTDDDLDDLNTALSSAIAQKRDESDPIPQDDITGLISALQRKPATKKLSSGVTITGTAGTFLNGIGFTVPANSEWTLEAYIDIFSTGSTDGFFNGAKFGLTVPSGSTVKGAISGETSTGTPKFESVTGTGLHSTVFLLSGQAGRISINANIDVGGASGTITPMAAVADSGDQIIIATSSFARIVRTD